MWRIMLLSQLLATSGSKVWFEGLRPPTDVHVGDSLLAWSVPPTHTNATTYTVQYDSFSKGWQNVPSCVRSQNTSCDVNATMKIDGFGCVRLRVHAHEHSLTSDTVEACSQQETSCSPKVQLSAQPGTLTVHLIGDHPLIRKHGLIQHLVFYGKEGEPLRVHGSSLSSVVINGLDEGQRYCVAVVFTYFDTRIAPPSCAKCIDIPGSDERAKSTWIAVGLVLLLVAGVLLVLLVVYVFLFQSGKIKAWMRPPYTMAQCIKEPFDTRPQQTLVHSEDHMSFIFPVEDHQPSTRTAAAV